MADQHKVSQDVILVPERRIIVQEQNGNDAAGIVQVNNFRRELRYLVIFHYQRHQVVKRSAGESAREGPACRYVNLYENVKET